ncbi:MAG: DUF3857 domain-containing protein [Thermoanaerobaculaceae bacterium]|nr:DUF3857 domain-containing protein [Thermoanaerobaculaceae bacterium]
MKRLKIAVALLVLVFSVAIFSQSPYLNTPTAKDYPDSDAIVLKEKIVFEIESDGKINQKVFRVEKVLTYQGLDHIGDPLVAFDKANQTLEIKKLRTYTKEGKVIDAKQNSFTEMTPFELEKSPDYTNIRQMVLTKVGLDIDSVVETEYEIKDFKPHKKDLEKTLLLREDIPVLEKEIEIRTAFSKELKIKLFNSSENIVKKDEGTSKVYLVVFKNLPRLYHSEMSNGEEYLTPFLVFTTASDWAEQSKYLNGEISQGLKEKTQEFKDKVAKLTEKCVSLYEKVKTVSDYTVSDYRTIDWNLGDFNYAPRKLSRIFETRYGNEIDKALLLGRMIETLGLKPEYYLYSDKLLPEIGGEIPALSIFDRVVLSVNVDGRTLFISPTASLEEFSARNIWGRKVLKIGENQNSLTIIPAPNVKNQIVFKAVLEPMENLKMKGASSVLLSGKYVNYESALKNGLETAISSLISSAIKNAEEIKVSAVEFTNEKIEAKADFVVDLKKETETKKVFANLITSIPEISLLKEFEGKRKREIPKLLSFNGDELYEITFSIPENAKIFNLPKNVSNSGDIRIYQDTSANEDKVTISFGCSIGKNQINQKDFEEATKSVSNLLSDSCRVVYLEEKKKK